MNIYSNLKELKPDKQVLLLCKNGAIGILDLDIVLRQYKFCVNHGVFGDDRDTLLEYLKKVVPEGDIQSILPPS